MFQLQSSYKPAGDQPTAIKELVEGLQDGEKHFIIKKEKWYSNILVMKDENEKVYFHLKRNFKWKDFY